jgi:disulfide bond formation protein DsbB
MLLLLGSLITIYVRLHTGMSGAPKSERYIVHLPFSVYLGWITIATIANVTALLVDIGWNNFGLSGQFWAVLVIVVGIAITLIVLSTRRDIFYALVVDWALLGILLKRLADTSTTDWYVTIATIAGLAIITLGILFQLVMKKVY